MTRRTIGGMSGQASPDGDLAAATAAFVSVRPRLFGIAYRVLGSANDAEDILQEAWLRWQNYDHSTVEDPAAFLATTTTRLAINFAQTARARHEAYVGPWLPEPVDTSADPGLGAERGEALGFAVLLLLEQLTPTERAAYVLREAFDYPYPQIAEIIQSSEASARQLVSRARRHIAGERPAVTTTAREQRRLLDAFLAAAQSGDVAELEKLLAADVVSYSDGGGRVRASIHPVRTRTTVAKFIHAFASHFWVGVTLEPVQANGQPASVLRRDGVPVAVVALVHGDNGIDQVLWMMNPDKLTKIAV